jgi:hypothetical protein
MHQGVGDRFTGEESDVEVMAVDCGDLRRERRCCALEAR